MKKRIALVIIAVLALPLLGAAQLNPDNTVSLVAYWHPGDQLVLESVMRRTQIAEDGTQQVTAQATQTITLDVLEETDKSYRLRISYSNVGPVTEGDIVSELSSAIMGNMSYEILTNQFGVVQDLSNEEATLKAMRDKIPGLVDGVLAKYDANTIKAQAVDRDDMIRRFSGVFDDAAFFASNYNRYLLPLFQFHGNRYHLDHEYTFEQTFYKIMDQGALDLNMTYVFDSEDCDKDYACVGSIAEADKEQMKPIAAAMGVDDVDMTMEEVSSLKIDLATGWPNDLYNKRTVHLTDRDTGEKLDIVWETGVTDRKNIN